MLPRASLILRRHPSTLINSRAMSATAYIIPFDPKSSSAQAVKGVDSAKLWASVPQDKCPPAGTTRVFFNTPGSDVTALTSLGEGFSSKKTEVKREIVRKSVGNAVKDIKKLGANVKDVAIDASTDPHAAGMYLVFVLSLAIA